jgi:Transglutaminase-like superfamily
LLIRLKKFLSLERYDQRMLIQALALLIWARLLLWIIPFPALHRRLARPPVRNIAPPKDAKYYMSTIERAARYVPGASCLTQSLAARRLLARAGHDATLRFGARRNAAGKFEAHAWIESNGQILSRPIDGDEFFPLPSSSSDNTE